MLRGQRCQRAVSIAIELDKHQVPKLDDPRITGVDQRRPGLVGCQVDVDFAARPTRARIAHLPEVVLLAAGMDVRRINVGDALPKLGGLSIRLEPVGFVALEIRGVQAVLVDTPNVGEQLPGPLDGLLLEIVAERPVAEHLEERVVVGVLPDVVEVIVLPARPDALLRVRSPRKGPRSGAQEDILELVHPGVGECILE